MKLKLIYLPKKPIAKNTETIAKLKLNNLIGYISNSIEDYETTLYHYEAALAIASKLEDIPRTTILLINLQSVYFLNKLMINTVIRLAMKRLNTLLRN